MFMSDGFFRSLETHFINGRLRDVPRWQPTAKQSSTSAAWLPSQLRTMLARQPELTEERRTAILQGLAQFASIVIGTNEYQTKLSPTYGAYMERPIDRTMII